MSKPPRLVRSVARSIGKLAKDKNVPDSKLASFVNGCVQVDIRHMPSLADHKRELIALAMEYAR